jgi:hypothetical protein
VVERLELLLRHGSKHSFEGKHELENKLAASLQRIGIEHHLHTHYQSYSDQSSLNIISESSSEVSFEAEVQI